MSSARGPEERAGAAVPKTRSRKDGAAIPLDDVDRRLLNLMQGSFPIVPPFGGALIELVLLNPPEIARASRLNLTAEMFEMAKRMMNSASSSVIMSA